MEQYGAMRAALREWIEQALEVYEDQVEAELEAIDALSTIVNRIGDRREEQRRKAERYPVVDNMFEVVGVVWFDEDGEAVFEKQEAV